LQQDRSCSPYNVFGEGRRRRNQADIGTKEEEEEILSRLG